MVGTRPATRGAGRSGLRRLARAGPRGRHRGAPRAGDRGAAGRGADSARGRRRRRALPALRRRDAFPAAQEPDPAAGPADLTTFVFTTRSATGSLPGILSASATPR